MQVLILLSCCLRFGLYKPTSISASCDHDGKSETDDVAPTTRDDDEIRSRIDEFVADILECRPIPGLSLAVVKGGQVACNTSTI